MLYTKILLGQQLLTWLRSNIFCSGIRIRTSKFLTERCWWTSLSATFKNILFSKHHNWNPRICHQEYRALEYPGKSQLNMNLYVKISIFQLIRKHFSPKEGSIRKYAIHKELSSILLKFISLWHPELGRPFLFFYEHSELLTLFKFFNHDHTCRNGHIVGRVLLGVCWCNNRHKMVPITGIYLYITTAKSVFFNHIQDKKKCGSVHWKKNSPCSIMKFCTDKKVQIL